MAYRLTPEQLAYFDSVCDLWERTRLLDTDGKRTPGNETWTRVAAAVPYYHQQTDNVFQRTAIGAAVEPNIMSEDHGFFASGVPLLGNPGSTRAQVVHNLTGAYAGYYDVQGPARQNPSFGLFDTNEQEVLLRFMEMPPAIPANPLTGGTLTAAPSSTTTTSGATVSIAAASGGFPAYTYLFQYANHGQNNWTNIGTAGSATSTSVFGLATGTLFDFRCIVSDTGGAGGQVASNTAFVTTLQEGALSVTGFTDTTLSLSWTAGSGGSGALTYQPQYRVQGTTLWFPFGSPISGTTVQITGLSQGTTYEARVVVQDALANQRATNTVTATTDLTVRIMLAAVNAIAGSGAGGTYKLWYYTGLGPTYQIINADGTSPTGYFCPLLDDVLAPGTGRHLRPRLDLNSGKGAPCLVTGEIMGAGLYLPASVLVAAGAYGPNDLTDVAGTVNNHVPNTLFDDHRTGITLTSIQRYRPNTTMWRIGASGSASALGLADIENMAAMADPTASGFTPPSTQNGTASQVLVMDTWAVSCPGAAFTVGGNANGNFMRYRFGRDLPWVLPPPSNGNLVDQTRDFYVIDSDGGFPAAGDSGNLHSYGFGFMAGRHSRAQTTLLHDFTDAEPYAPWKDIRDIAYWCGDSEQQPISQTDANDPSSDTRARTFLAHIIRGYKGRGRIQRTVLGSPRYFTLALFAFSGHTVSEFQYSAYLKYLADCDFKNRASDGRMAHFWEFVNDGDVTRNVTALDYAKSLGLRTSTYNTGRQLTNIDPSGGVYDDAAFVATLITAGHAEFRANIRGKRRFSSTNWGNGIDGDPAGPSPIWFTNRHPITPDTQESDEAWWAATFMWMLGLDISNLTVELVPSADKISLSAGTPTASPTWTAVNYLGTTLSGKAPAFTSRDVSIATVNASTGVITRVAAGRVGIDVWSNDGGKGTIDVVCS